MILNNPNITVYNIPAHTPEWFKFRSVGVPAFEGGVGASETSTVMGMNDYAPTKTELFRIKVGLDQASLIESEPMFHGTMLEDYILNCWKHDNGQQGSYVENIRLKKQVRNASKPVGYIVNSKWPWLFASPDALADPGSFDLINGEVKENGFNIEIKKINSMAAKKWESGVPLKYIMQVQHQMLVLEMDYTELILFKDGDKIEIVPIRANEQLQHRIISETYSFWQNVLEARKAFASREEFRSKGKMDSAVHMDAMIQKMEPLPDGNENYAAYYSPRYARIEEKMMGTADHYTMALERMLLAAAIKNLDFKKTALENQFSEQFVRHSVEVIDFGGKGKVKYNKRANSTTYHPYFYLTVIPDEVVIEKEVSKMMLENAL